MHIGRQFRGVLFSVAILSLAFSLSCTRKQEGSAKIKIDMSGLEQGKSGKTLNSADIFFTALNITGPGLSTPLLKNWERCHDCTNTAPSTIEVELPRGSGYLFQFLAASKDENGGLVFSYGDAKKDLNLANESVSISMAEVASGAKEGDLIGRYMTAANMGPTGRVAMKYKPEGKPAMRVLYESIFGGWFNSFLFLDTEDTFLEFVLIKPDGSEGSKIFEGLTPASTSLQVGSHLMQLHFPQSYRLMGNGNREISAEKSIYFGYFGYGATSKRACYLDSPGEISNLTTDVNGQMPVAWDTEAPVAPSSAGVAGGGEGASTCSPLVAYTDALQFDHSQFSNRNGAGFEGPYAKPDQADPWNSFFSSTLNANTLTLTWKYLPGVLNSSHAITGSALYYKTDSSGSNNSAIDDGGSSYNCDNLDASQGFTRVLIPGPNVTYSLPNISKTLLEQNKVKVALCPYRNNPASPGGVETFNDGIETHGFQHLIQVKPSIKVVGSSYQSNIFDSNSILNSNDKLLTSSLVNGFHNIIPQVGGQLLHESDVLSLSFSIDGIEGGAWKSFTESSPTLSFEAGTFSGVSLNDAEFISAVLSEQDQTVRFKFTLTNPAAYGLSSPDYITPPVTLIGSDNCVSPVLKLKKLSDGSLYDESTFLAEGDFSTSYDESFKLVWTGSPSCEEATAVIDYFSFTAAEVCLSKERRDIYFDPDQPFAFRIDPGDLTGEDCSFATQGPTSLQFLSPSNAGINSMTKEFGSLILKHSTTPTQISPYLVASNPTLPFSPYSLGVAVKKWITHAGNSLSAKLIKENDDKRIVDKTSGAFAGTITAWDVKGNHFTPDSTTSDFVSLMASTPSDSKTQSQTFSNASTSGKLLTAIRNTNDAVVFVADQHFWGDSALIVSKDGSNNHSVHFMPNNSGDFKGTSLKTIGNGPTINTSLRVFVHPLHGLSNNHGVFALGYGNTLYMVAVSHESLAAVWSNPVTLNAGQEVVGMTQQGSSGLLIFSKQDSDQTLGVYAMDLANAFNGSSWSMPPGGLGLDNFDSSIVPFDVVKCGHNEIAVIGRDYADSTLAKALVYNSTDIATSLATLVSGVGFLTSQNRGACMRLHLNYENEPIYTFAFYSDTSSPTMTPLKMLSYNRSGESQCSIDPNGTTEPALASFASHIASATGPVVGLASGLRYGADANRTSYFFGAFPTATETGLHRFTAQCSAGSFLITLDTIGSVPNTSGLSYLSHMHEGPYDKQAWLYGQSLGLIEALLD